MLSMDIQRHNIKYKKIVQTSYRNVLQYLNYIILIFLQKVRKQTVMIDQVVNEFDTVESDGDEVEDIEGDREPANEDDNGDDVISADEESRNVIR